MKTLVLTETDVKRLVSIKEAMEAVELAFAEKGLNRVQMPLKQFLFLKNYNGDLRTMPSHLEGLDISAVKVVTVYPENRAKHNLPSVTATLLVIDPKNGMPIAIMGATWISDIGTGAAGGVAAKYLSRANSSVVGLVGAGAQARTQLMALCALYQRLDEVRVWSRTRETKEAFVKGMKTMCPAVDRFVQAEEAEDAVKGADIVVTTTPSIVPLVLNDWIAPGMHISCVGADAPNRQELDPAVLKRAKIVVDDWEQASHSGEINVPLSQGILKRKDVSCELGEIVAGLKQGRASSDEITVFASAGLAMQDAVAANIAYKKAMASGIGQMVEFV